MAKVFDCFTFFNELELLELRLNELNPVVDYFVLEFVETFVRFQRIGEDRRTSQHVLADFRL